MLTGITFEEFLEIRVEEVEERAAKEKEAAVKKAEVKVAEEKDQNFVMKLLRKNWPVEEIQELTEVPMDKILEIKNAIAIN